jgi:hypothetical protein
MALSSLPIISIALREQVKARETEKARGVTVVDAPFQCRRPRWTA